ncbi:MAG: LLM class flavin-dependent oxidoreductase [Dehalococcoidia bacterium]
MLTTLLDHRGAFFRTRGPLPVPRTPQGRPVIIQAGQSGRGRRFAARWGELLFMIHPTIARARQVYREVKDEVARLGRDPRLSEVLNFDFATKELDEPFSAEELASIGGLQALRNRVVEASGKANPTTRDFITYSGRGMLHEIPRFIGTTKTIADGLEEWFTTEACDGFMLAATHVPGAYEEFVRMVVPELQRRGLFRRACAGSTLRDHLGVPRAQRGDWKR